MRQARQLAERLAEELLAVAGAEPAAPVDVKTVADALGADIADFPDLAYEAN